MLKNRIKNPILREIAEWAVALALMLLLFLVLHFFVFRVAHVTGGSMMPTLNHGDIVVLNRLEHLVTGPRAGDIVAFPNPSDPSQYYIKRVIGVPGDIVDLQDGVFWVNGVELVDDFSQEPIWERGDVVFPITVEDGRYFVLGDNRNGTIDSRHSSVGNVCSQEMFGRTSLRIWPLERFGRIR